MGQFVIVAYRAHPGREERLRELLRTHVPTLRSQGLATNHQPYVMRAGDGTFVEVFEWESAEAVGEAHGNDRVKAMWADFEEACEYEKIENLPESLEIFSSFESVDPQFVSRPPG